MKLVKLQDVCEIIMGQSPPSSTYNESGQGLPFYQGKTDFGKYYPTPSKFCTAPKRIAEQDDVLMSVRAPVGDVNIAQETSCIGRGIAALRASEKVNAKYLFYVLQSIKEKISQKGTGSTFKAINKKSLGEIKVPYFSISNQKKIVRIFEQSSELIEKRKQQIEALSALKQSVFFDMFGDPNSTDCKFAKKRIGEVFEVQTGKTPSRKRIDYWDKEEVPWIKTTEVQNVEINTNGEFITKLAMEENKLKLFPVDTILIAMYGQGKTRGQSGILKFPATCNQACAALLPSEEMEMKFVWNQLLILYDNLRALGRGGNQPNLNLSLVRGFEIIVPPNGIQKKYADKVNKIDESIQKIKNSLEQLTILYDSLLHKAFNGELFKEEIKA